VTTAVSTAISTWDELARECDAWAAEGRIIELWWRDDDAVEDSPALRQLLACAPSGVPVALAVIPALVQPSLANALAGHRSISVLQHGFDHRNRAPEGTKKSEFPAGRAWAEAADGLVRGRNRLSAAFGTRFVPVLTPPWNRIDRSFLSGLRTLGYRGISTYLPRPAGAAIPQVNTHVDVIDWHGGRGFVGVPATLGLIVGHLRAKRLGTADPAEPTGLLTHHLVHDTEAWEFLGAFLDWCAKRPNIQWRSAADLFPELGAK
jgi:hypothetical protein